MLTVKEMNNLQGKRVIVRVDFNVPLKGGEIRLKNYSLRVQELS